MLYKYGLFTVELYRSSSVFCVSRWRQFVCGNYYTRRLSHVLDFTRLLPKLFQISYYTALITSVTKNRYLKLNKGRLVTKKSVSLCFVFKMLYPCQHVLPALYFSTWLENKLISCTTFSGSRVDFCLISLTEQYHLKLYSFCKIGEAWRLVFPYSFYHALIQVSN